MSPYWSQERLFGHWGPTNRLVFRVLIIAVVLCLSLMVWALLQYANYADRLNAYVHQARTDRLAAQQAQQAQINAANNAAELARAAARDVACFTVAYAHRANPKSRSDPFIKALSERYDCAHYKIPPHFPPAGSLVPPTPSPSPSAPKSRTRTPGASPTPSSSPRPRTSTIVVARPGPTVTRTSTVTRTQTQTKTLPAPSPSTTTVVVCVMRVCLD